MNLNSLLYSLRKISKYLCYSLLIIAFIIVCLLLSGSKVLAVDGDITITVPDGDFVGKFSSNVTYTIASDGTLSVAGTIENHNMGITYPVKYNEFEDYYIVPFASQNYSTTNYFYAKVPKTANFWGYTSWGYNENNTNMNLNVNLVSDVPFDVYGKAYYQQSFGLTAGSVTSFTENHTCCIPLCNFYTDSNKTLQIFSYNFEPEPDPIIFVNYEEDTQHDPMALISGEFVYFHFKVPKSLGDNRYTWTLFFHDITNVQPPDEVFVNDTTSVLVDPSSYVSGSEYQNVPLFFSGDYNNDYWFYSIPSVYPFGAYLNNHTYMIYSIYSDGDGGVIEQTYTWTTNFSSAGIQQQIDNMNNPALAKRRDYMNALVNGDIYGEYIDIPQMSVSDPTLSFFTTLVTTITDAFYNASMNETITLSFLGQDFIINSSDFNFLGGSNNQSMANLRNFLSAGWAFFIGYIIYKDLRRRVIMMKEFHWSHMFADDISVNML